jgi:hypothetical protein
MTMDPTWLALAAGVVCAAAAAFALLRARRRRNESQILKTEIRKWEDEGGNVPQVPTVSPAGTPDRSVPARR